jgi:hypothetical protein
MSMLHSATAFTSAQEIDVYEWGKELFVQETQTGTGYRLAKPTPENKRVNLLSDLLAELEQNDRLPAASDLEVRISIKRADDTSLTAPGANAALRDQTGRSAWPGAAETTAGSDEINAAPVRIAHLREEVGSACALLSYAIATAQENDANRRVVDLLKEKRSRLRSIERRLHV